MNAKPKDCTAMSADPPTPSAPGSEQPKKRSCNCNTGYPRSYVGPCPVHHSEQLRGDELVVTPLQFSEGWILNVNGVTIHRRFRLIRRLPSGDSLVERPSAAGQILSDGTVL